MKFDQAEKIVTPHIKNVEDKDENGKPILVPKVYLYPQGRQFGSDNRVEPIPFPTRIAIHHVMTGGWGLAPNLKDEKTVLTVIEKAQTEFAEKQAQLTASKDREIEELKAQLAQVGDKRKTAKV